MNRKIYFAPSMDIVDVVGESGFAGSSFDDTSCGTGDVSLDYGGYDNEFE